MISKPRPSERIKCQSLPAETGLPSGRIELHIELAKL
jgi:hypothetical protein